MKLLFESGLRLLQAIQMFRDHTLARLLVLLQGELTQQLKLERFIRLPELFDMVHAVEDHRAHQHIHAIPVQMIEKIADLLHILQGFALQTQFLGVSRRKQA